MNRSHQRSLGKLLLCLLLRVAATDATDSLLRTRQLADELSDVAPVFLYDEEEEDQGIRGGTDATSGLSWLGVFNEGVVCGVVLVHSDIVITTAACATAAGSFPASVRIGSIRLTSGGTVVNVNKGLIHPNYKIGNVTAGNDIAVLQLSSQLTNTVALMNENATVPQTDAQLLFVAGFGASSNTNVPAVMQELFYNNVENCFQRSNVYRPEFHMCADASPARGTCAGDAGSPAVLPGSRVIVGLNSFSNSNECETQTIDVYTRMSSYTVWVKQQICDMSANPPSYCKEKDPCLFDFVKDAFANLFGP
jgi:secreted trypsin-like serine protease